MRRTGRVAQLNLLLICAALLVLLAAVAWLAPPLAGPAAAQPPAPDEPAPGGEDPLLDGAPASENISPTTILEIFFSSSAGEWSGEPSAAVQADLEGLSPSGALYVEAPVLWNPGGTHSMDWGDVNRDGYLDLIAASVDRVAVYANEQGKLKLKWTEARSGLGVRWFDLDPGTEPRLEAVVVGEGGDGPPAMTIYLQPESSSSSVRYDVPAQLLRVEPGDFDVGDGVEDIDLVASTNALDPPSGCPVVLFRRQAGDPPYGDTQNPECVSDEATASLAAADADGDGDLDLALGLHSSKEIRVLLNSAGSLATDSITVDDHLAHIPYDLAWGDYNRDGWLDLAAAFPLEQEVRIYDNNDGASFTKRHTLTTDSFLTPLAVDWADLDGDGRLELLVADLPPKIYDYDDDLAKFTVMDVLPVQTGRIQEIRAIDADNDADLDVAVANQYVSSALFANTAPLLGPNLTSLPGGGAGSVAWGDAAGHDVTDYADGYLDLLVGGSLYTYDDSSGDFGTSTQISGTAKIGAFGDFNGDGDLDVALGNEVGCGVCPGPDWSDIVTVPLSGCSDPSSFAWADYDDNGFLDLAVALPSGVTVYAGTEDGSPFPVLFSDLLTGGARDVAWADYDGDQWLDLAVARGTQGVLLYHHELDGSLLEVDPALADGCDARSLAWGDWDGDEDEDLAVGCFGSPNLIYENTGSTLVLDPASGVGWESPVVSATTSLAWGDWDNDGDLDLAVGNDGERDRVYANKNGTLALRWESTEELSTNAMAWGDKDGDGDLDLAVTADDGSGWYANNYVLPAHLGDAYRPLPRNPSYLSVARPGTTPGAYFYSSPEILAGPETEGSVAFEYTLYDPENDPVAGATYSYSLDSGGHWIPTTHVSPAPADWTAEPGGTPHTLYWNARADGAVSDNARFRITIVHGKPAGPVQRASTSATSPPFRVRATTCVWPGGLSIWMSRENPIVYVPVTFTGDLAEGTGSLSFLWDLGDGQTETGQSFAHTYYVAREYTVEVTVTGEACPVTRQALATRTFEVVEARSPGGMTDPHRLYLPLILRNGAGKRP